MARDLDDIEHEWLVARIRGTRPPEIPALPAAVLLEANPRKAPPNVHLDVYRMPDPPKGTAKKDKRVP